MKISFLLTVTSLLTIVLEVLHTADDIARGMEKGGLFDLAILVPLSVLWLYGSLVLQRRLAGIVIILLNSLLGLAVPYIHMKGEAGVGELAKTDGGFFFVATLLFLGVSSLFAFVLSIHALWAREWMKVASSKTEEDARQIKRE